MAEDGVGKVRMGEGGRARGFKVDEDVDVVRLETEITLDSTAEVGIMLLGEADDADEYDDEVNDNITAKEGAAFANQILVLFQTVNLELPPQVFAQLAKGPDVTVPLQPMLQPV